MADFGSKLFICCPHIRSCHKNASADESGSITVQSKLSGDDNYEKDTKGIDDENSNAKKHIPFFDDSQETTDRDDITPIDRTSDRRKRPFKYRNMSKFFQNSGIAADSPVALAPTGGRVLPHLESGKDLKAFWKDHWTTLQSVGPRMPDIESALTCPRHVDFLIIGGGIMGNSIAYWFRRFLENDQAFAISIVEPDNEYRRSSTTLSVGGIRQQFSLSENIQLSLESAHFLRRINENLGVIGCDPPDIAYHPGGYLTIASKDGADQMLKNHKLQKDLGAEIKLLTPTKVKEKFPWINTNGIEMAALGVENEGWFDPWSLLNAFRIKNKSTNIRYIKGTVTGFGIYEDPFSTSRRLDTAYITLPNGDIQPVVANSIINCAGPWAGIVHEMFEETSRGESEFPFPLPVEPRKRFVYVFHSPDGPGLEMPCIIDNSGAYVRREGLGGNYLCGLSPTQEEEPDPRDLDKVDESWFYDRVWPLVAHRVPSFENMKLKSSWAGWYDYNYKDQNLIMGWHPEFPNFWMCTGLSGHGLQMAPAIGRHFIEYFNLRYFRSLDLSRFTFSRFMNDDLVFEQNIW